MTGALDAMDATRILPGRSRKWWSYANPGAESPSSAKNTGGGYLRRQVPLQDTFEPRNTWPLFNSFREALREGTLAELSKRTEALHGLLDVHVGLGLN